MSKSYLGRFTFKANAIVCNKITNLSENNSEDKLKLIYDTPFYLCQIEQYENNILLKDDYDFWDKKKN